MSPTGYLTPVTSCIKTPGPDHSFAARHMRMRKHTVTPSPRFEVDRSDTAIHMRIYRRIHHRIRESANPRLVRQQHRSTCDTDLAAKEITLLTCGRL